MLQKVGVMIEIISKSVPDSPFSFRTSGLGSFGHPDIQADFTDGNLASEAEQFLKYLSNYIAGSPRKILSGETMSYGYWLVKFQDLGQNLLETFEYNAHATDFVRGVNLTLRYWRDQHLMCNVHGGEFSPPRPDKLTVVSEGVFEGLPVEGVRYPSPDHMSGWWITTELYNGDIKSLRNEHTYHITAARPDIAKYLALPFGFRFNLSATEDAWLDEKVANAK
jgi:hypothetical protein